MNLLSLKDWNATQIDDVLELALRYKRDPRSFHDALKGKSLLMLFEKTSTRTRISFESGFSKMGGHAIYLDSRTSNLVLSELRDEVRYMTRNVDLIMARMLRNADLVTLAQHALVPVINGCCELYHPCQAFSDLLTIKERFGRLSGVTVTYVGMRNNVCNELISGLTKTGAILYQVTPPGGRVVEEVDAAADATGRLIRTQDLRMAVERSDIVYTDTWIDMEFFRNPEMKEQNDELIGRMLPYQVNASLVANNPSICVMHDMPMHVGYEITRDIIESDRSIIFQQAENRMWLQNALMLRLLGAC